jgi:hypothetical protein
VCGGAGACIPTTCAAQGWNCGLADDGCGNILNCGGTWDAGVDASGSGPGCTPPQVCGGGADGGPGTPNVCGPIIACTGLCAAQVTCPGGGTTTVTGTVYAPNATDPIYQAIVYVPQGTVDPLTDGASAQCTCTISGNPLIQSPLTGVDGVFTLNDFPVGVAVPIVIQMGPWRRQISVTVPTAQECTTITLTPQQTSLPNCETGNAHCAATNAVSGFASVFGDVPLVAMDTGAVDSTECVLRKMGLDDSEFGDPGGSSRIQFFYGDTAAGATIDRNTPSEDTLWSTTTIDNYDMVIFACQGAGGIPRDNVGNGVESGNAPSVAEQNVINFANAGGRIFATHYNYTWLGASPGGLTAAADTDAFSAAAVWDSNQGYDVANDPETGFINMGFPRGAALANWLQLVVGGTLGQITVNTLRHDFDSVVAPTDLWMNVDDSYGDPRPIELSFDTPIGNAPAAQCGRVQFEDYHVEDKSNNKTTGQKFPNECDNNPMTPQEKLLEFQLFDLAACLAPPTTCIQLTCANSGPGGTMQNCGLQSDGCGGLLNCGTCAAPETCGGGGSPGVCGGTTCVGSTCTSLNMSCGSAGDGCGGTLNCGTCPSGMTCDVTAMGSSCVTPNCTPFACSAAGPGGSAATCGNPPNGCGSTLSCGTCPAGQICGTSFTCITPSCTPLTTCPAPDNCGTIPDGCGGTVNCGTCTAPLTCGGSGTLNVCGSATCIPLTACPSPDNCGTIGDGCGGTINCGTCTAPQTCGGEGTPNVCGGTGCTPFTCGNAGPDGGAYNCGTQANGCGGSLNCGTCTPPETCGGGGSPGVCGNGGCVPLTACPNGENCGTIGDGCGGTLNCGTCTPPQTCGGGGMPSVCGGTACVPTTCTKLGLNCGTQADGCGGSLNCGTCTAPDTCGGGGTPGVCGTATCQPTTCTALGFNCGPAGDGCGGALNCGTCTAPETCGGGGKPSVCGDATCKPTTCTALGFNCGPAGDGCGGELQCGTCQPGWACGAGGKPGVCAPLEAGACAPETCAQQNLSCGPAGDGCGNVIQCGTCVAPLVCGAGGTPGKCGSTGCTPETCAQQNLNCGPAGDGCGGSLNCGTCVSPDTCGGGGVAGQCGTMLGTK